MMVTFDEFSEGDTFSSPERRIDAEAAAQLVALGGYTHPLFTDPAYAAATQFGRSPLPGQALLLVMGGLVEQSGRFDETTIALLGFEDVRFLAPAFPGDAVRVDAEVVAKDKRERRGSILFRWKCVNDRGELLVEASARMLFALDGHA